MKRNMSKREEVDKMAIDFDDIIVRSVDGLIAVGDNEEVKLLFYYVKPELFIEEEDVIEGKAVAELRISTSKFMNIVKEINIKAMEIREGKDEISMFG
jgi:hypothetical protein